MFTGFSEVLAAFVIIGLSLMMKTAGIFKISVNFY
jgi:hypothetical protein